MVRNGQCMVRNGNSLVRNGNLIYGTKWLWYEMTVYVQKHVRKVVGGFGKKSCVSTGGR